MRHVPSDKYTIAWFKLAECIERGEREKAYGVYRLLAHSIADQAYAYQLEGDLLRSFEDPRAYQKYQSAAKLYYQERRWHEAAGLCEHLKLLGFLTLEQRLMMIDIHQQLGNRDYSAALKVEVKTLHPEQEDYAAVDPQLHGLAQELLAKQPKKKA